MDKTRPDVAASLHECFEAIDTAPLLPETAAPALLLSGDNSGIASAQQQILADSVPHGRLQLFEGYGRGISLVRPLRCARAALAFWREIERPAA
jgi:pimeloyl-ACP methyl ester carboxylesterase